MEETTTSTQVDESTASENTEQAVDTTNEQAVENESSQEETASSTDESEETKVSDDDAEIKAWAEKKGLKLDDPIAMAKMIREGDKKVTQATQSAKLDASVKTASQDLDEVQQLRNEVAVINFFQKYPDARELETDMAKVIDDKPYLASDLDALYFYTKGVQSDKGLLAAKQAGSKEALQKAAAATRGGAPKTSASVRTAPTKLTSEDIKNMSLQEYQTAKAEGLIVPFQ